jgi:glycosyltransferase involved in cell wall biosynthesis
MNEKAAPLVSVVIPTYNHANYLGRALQSVFDQSYTNWEAIVIDNHSTDKTDEVMASIADQRIIYLKIHNNGVIAASRNLGIRTAKAEWIAFLDSDDWWTADKLQVCFDSINDKVDLIYHDLEIVTDKHRPFSRKIIKSRQVRTPVLIDLLLKGNAIVNSSVVVRKSVLQQIGGINESMEMIASEDYNTWLYTAQLTEQFVYLPRSLGYYLIHNHSISQKEMSESSRFAVADFVPMLNTSQKLKLEANFRYISGRFNYLAGNNAEAREDLLFGVKRGCFILKIKAVILLLMLMGKY